MGTSRMATRADKATTPRPEDLADCIVTEMADRLLLAGGTPHLLTDRNTWARIDGSDPSLAALIDISVDLSAPDGIALLQTAGDARYWSAVSRTVALFALRNGSGVSSLASDEMHDRTRYAVLPFNDGTAWDFGARSLVEDVPALLLLECGWDIPPTPPQANFPFPPDFIDVMDHYGDEWLQLIADGLRRRDKSVRTLVSPVPDFGKSLLWHVMRRAFRGAVHLTEDSHSLTGDRNRFSQATEPLSRCLWVAYDEVDKVELNFHNLAELTAPVITLERKFLDPAQTPAIGTPYFVGGDWPNLDMNAQGADVRLAYACWRDEAGPLTPAQARCLADNPDLLRQRLVNMAAEPNPHAGSARKTAAEMRRVRMPANVAALREVFVATSNRADTVPTADIRTVLSDAGVEVPGDKAFPELMRRAFGSSVKPDRFSSHRYYSHLARVDDVEVEQQ